MSSSTLQVPRKSETYHHGDLKNALLGAARALANEVGVDNFTLREVARRAGVSSAAPYHHFADKNDLVRGLAIQAFESLTAELEAAAQSEPNSVKQLEQIGLAYVRFALSHPNEFRFMFRRELCAPPGQFDPLQEVGRVSQAVLEKAILDGLHSKQLEGQAPIMALMLWSVVHGLANILLETPFGKNTTSEAAQDMATRVIQQSIQSLLPHKPIKAGRG
jgi:AcrR family transcriptional regulator